MANPGLCVPAHTPHPRSSSPGPPGAQDPHQEMLEADMGSPLVLTCQVPGVPMPAVTWLKDGSPLGMCTRGHHARLPSRAFLLPRVKQSCLSFPISNPAVREWQEPQGGGRARRGWHFPRVFFKRHQLKIWDEIEGELSGYQPLGYALGRGFAPRPVALFSRKAAATRGADTLLCRALTSALTKPPSLGPGGGKEGV